MAWLRVSIRLVLVLVLVLARTGLILRALAIIVLELVSYLY